MAKLPDRFTEQAWQFNVQPTMKRFALLLYVMLIASTFAQPIPSELRKTVGFIFRNSPNGLQPFGTCFAVGVPVGTNAYRVGLVTARHIMFGNLTSTNIVSNLWLRVNCRDKWGAINCSDC